MFAGIVIFMMIIATVAVAARWLAPRMAEGRIIWDVQADRPHAFGYKMSWLAIRTRDTQRLLDVLGITDVHRANWNTGLGSVYNPEYGETHLFIPPPLNGWTFVVGLGLPHPIGRNFVDKMTPLLVELGRHFIEVQYYFCYPAIDFFAWARVVDGKLVRAFAIGDEGIVWNIGKPAREEKALGLQLFELRGVRGRRGDAGGELVLYPTEDHVMRLAAKWSLDPTRIDQIVAERGVGYIGRTPKHWRAQRLRKIA